MKNKGLVIALIILLTIVVFFLIMFLVVYLNSENNFKIGLFNIGSRNNNVIYNKTFELEKIDGIEIKQDTGDVIFKESEDDSIQVVLYGENQGDADVALTNHNLNIDYTHKTKFAFFSFGTAKNDIIIYIPSNYKNDIKITNDYGDCEVIDLENARVNIECDAGEVRLGTVKDATIKCDYGNIRVKEILNKCDMEANCGNIEIETISIKENSSIKADLGNVDIDKTADIYIDADVDLGKSNINNNNRNSEVTLKINCDCGNITINN